MGEFKVGDKVYLHENSEFNDGSNINPLSILGTVITYDPEDILDYEVKWENGTTNGYNAEDLQSVQELWVNTKDPLVTIPESEYHSLIEEVNMLQELVKELSAPQDTALEQQAETYRVLNETLTRHESFQAGEDGASTTRCEELLNTIDFLHEVYDDWKTNEYRVAVASAGSDAFKPISEYTLEDWQQAIDEDWEFECRDKCAVQITEVDEEDVNYPVKGTDNLWRDIEGFWATGRTDPDDIVKRIR